MGRDIKFSIITVVRNASQSIGKILSSIDEQGSEKVEHIVVDGNSTDGTTEILERYRERFSRLIIEEDGGPTEAINKALLFVSGDFVGFLLAGDWYNPGALAIVAEQADKGDVLCGDMLNWCDAKPVYVSCADPARLGYEMSINFPATFFRASVVQRVGGFEKSFDIATDYDFILRCIASGAKLHRVEAVLANMTLDGRSAQYWVKGYWHAARSKTLHLGSPVKNVAFFALQVVRTAVRISFDALGLHAVVRFYRARLSPCRKSIPQ